MELRPRPVLDSVEELLAGAEERQALSHAGKSGARLERVTLEGRRYIVKYLDEDDWTLRASRVTGSPTVVLWQRGLLDALPGCFSQPIVAVAHDAARPDLTALLMRDVSADLVPVVEAPIPAAQHDTFLDHMAALHAAFWETSLDIDVVTLLSRYLELSPSMAAEELARGSSNPVPSLVARGWPRLREVAPSAARVALPLAHDPTPLVTALAGTPQTFVHGCWKLDNLGTDPQGRTVLLDWETPGRAPALSDLAWYLAINCRRLPTSKERAIETYRDALDRRGVATEPWWDRQLALSLLGALVLFGWEKALQGYDDELAWWEARALAAEALL